MINQDQLDSSIALRLALRLAGKPLTSKQAIADLFHVCYLSVAEQDLGQALRSQAANTELISKDVLMEVVQGSIFSYNERWSEAWDIPGRSGLSGQQINSALIAVLGQAWVQIDELAPQPRQYRSDITVNAVCVPLCLSMGISEGLYSHEQGMTAAIRSILNTRHYPIEIDQSTLHSLKILGIPRESIHNNLENLLDDALEACMPILGARLLSENLLNPRSTPWLTRCINECSRDPQWLPSLYQAVQHIPSHLESMPDSDELRTRIEERLTLPEAHNPANQPFRFYQGIIIQ